MNRIALLYDEKTYARNSTFAALVLDSAESHGIVTELVIVSDAQAAISLDHLGTELSIYDLVLVRSRSPKLLEYLASSALPTLNTPLFTLLTIDKLQLPFLGERGGIRTLPTALWTKDETPPWMPLVIKDRYGHGGNQVHLITDPEDLGTFSAFSVGDDWICQPYCESGKVEYRAYVVGASIPYVIQKTATDGLRANLSQGALIEPASLPSGIISSLGGLIAGLPFGYFGIDFFLEDGEIILNELEDPVGARAVYTLGLGDPATDLIRLASRYLRT